MNSFSFLTLKEIPLKGCFFCDINLETVKRFRKNISNLIFKDLEKLSDEDFLVEIEAVCSDRRHITKARLLMFSNSITIAKVFPNFFLDYREVDENCGRWTKRIVSFDDGWSGNLYDFYEKVSSRLFAEVLISQRLKNFENLEEKDVRLGISLLLVFLLSEVEIFANESVVFEKREDTFSITVPKEISEEKVRQTTIYKMFNLLDKRFSNKLEFVFKVWKELGWKILTEEQEESLTISFEFFPKKNEKQRIQKETKKDNQEEINELVENFFKNGKEDFESVSNLIINLCSIKPLSSKEIAELLKKSPNWILRHYLVKLVERGRLQLLYPNKPRCTKQKYFAKENKANLEKG